MPNLGPGLHAGSSPGTGISGGSIPSAAGPAEPNPNLLFWSEALDNAAWTKSAATVNANAGNDRDGAPTADEVVFGANGQVGQTTTTAAATGALVSTSDILAGGGIERWFVTGAFDGADYVFSIDLEGPSSTPFVLQITRSGGFLRPIFRDGGDEATILASQAKLELGTSPGTYVKREGT